MPNPLENKFIALGVSGSIACHKAVDLASKLTQQGALVDVVMTTNALNFVTPLAFQAITHRPVVSNLFDPQSEVAIDHVAVAARADAMVIAPATANTIARMAWGLADDALTTTVLATRAPIIVCPAMDGYMYENPATQENLQRLSAWGHTIAGPAEGRMASGLKGKGRMLEVPEILGHVSQVLGRGDDLAERKVVVSAGGTREAIDPVRFISNRSSGKMGYAIAEAARDRGAEAVIVAAPGELPDPVGIRVVHVVSAEEMRGRRRGRVAGRPRADHGGGGRRLASGGGGEPEAQEGRLRALVRRADQDARHRGGGPGEGPDQGGVRGRERRHRG